MEKKKFNKEDYKGKYVIYIANNNDYNVFTKYVREHENEEVRNAWKDSFNNCHRNFGKLCLDFNNCKFLEANDCLIKGYTILSIDSFDWEEILNNKEKEYLRNVIRPFKENVNCVIKTSYKDELSGNIVKYKLMILTNDYDYMSFVPFDLHSSMYCNMVADKKYTLKELDLFS